jgi:hypothetical protein
MNIPLLLFLLIVLLIVWLFVRRRGQVETERPEPVRRRSSSNTAYHAVSIAFEPNACNAAKELAGRRFLSTAAPRLPLADCTASDCRCKFKHYDDRRSGKDRRNPFSPSGGIAAATGKFEAEQRDGSERRRRKADDDDLENYFG